MAIKTNLDTGAITPQRLEFLLPSCGMLYKSKKLGKGQGFPSTITVSPYSFITEGILNSNGVSFEKMRDVAKAVISNFPPDFDWNTMLVGDLTVTLALARALTYGETYAFDSECPACGHPEDHTIKVPDELPVRTWKHLWEKTEDPMLLLLPGLEHLAKLLDDDAQLA